jgi:Putative transposase
VLSKVFRGKLLELFERSLHKGTSGLGSLLGDRLLRQAACRPWVVYSKAPLAGPAQVLHYLGRYTHRIAIGNERLVALDNGRVTFRYRARQHGNAARLLTLDAPHFVQRFLLHVLPRGFVRVRHFGLQANGCRSRLIARVRELLSTPAPIQPDPSFRESWQDLYHRLTGRDPRQCPYCLGSTLRIVALPAPQQRERGP